tara:strand:+ start:273 stop:2366 length:2094 start_codon:yes stop_codon:yes gene_type:complete
MQKLQLYIGTERVDLFKDETVSLTQSIQNVKDISKIFTEFSKTFSLPASKVNNKIFKHYYNFDIRGGFDARNKVAGKIELNTLPFKEGFIKLEGVDLKNSVPHTYKITFFGNTINLKDVLGDDQLSRLSQLSADDTTYEYSTIKTKLTANPTSNICVPLITHTDRLTYNSQTPAANNVYWQSTGSANGVTWNQLKYAIRLQTIIDAIETETRYQNADGTQKITFSNDFFNDTSNTKFYNLWMWLHRKKGTVEPATQLSINFVSLSDLTKTSGNTGYTNEINGILTLMPDGQQTPDGTTQYLETKLEIEPTDNTIEYTIQVFKNSQIYEQRQNVTGSQTFFNTSSTMLSAGSYSISIGSINPISFASTKIKWTISVGVLGQGGGGGTDIWSNQNTFTTGAVVDFNITEQIPEMTVIDFLTSIFKMFNLTAYVDNSGVIVVRTLDSYYAAGSATPINIDQYLDVTKSTVDVALPFKEIAFSYTGVGTFLAKQYNQLNNIAWGATKFTLDNATFDAPNNVYKVDIPFEHVMYERLVDAGITTSVTNTTVQYGFFVDDNQEPYYGLPLVFYAIYIQNGNNISFKNTAGQNEQINDYVIPSNSLEIGTSTTTNINFAPEINEYDGVEFAGTLFQDQYSSYISKVFNRQRRLTKVSAMLPLKIFYNLQLNDKIQFQQNSYKINSITTDLTTGKSSIELLNVVE